MVFQPLSISAPRSNGPISTNSTNSITTTNSNNNFHSNSNTSGVGGSNTGREGEEDIKVDVTSPHELTQFVDNLLDNLEARFDTMNKDVLGRLSSLSTRIDSLESSIGDLMSGASTGSLPDENESSTTS